MAYSPDQLEQYKTSDPLFYAIASFNQSQDPNQSGGLATFLQATGKYPDLGTLDSAARQAGLGDKYYPDGVSGSTRNRAFFNARDAQIISFMQQQAIAQKNAGQTLGQIPISAEDQAAAARSGTVYSRDANGQLVQTPTGADRQSGASVTQTYTLNGQTFTTPPGGAVPVGATKGSDSTGTYQQVPQNTPAEPLQAQTQALNSTVGTPPGIMTPNTPTSTTPATSPAIPNVSQNVSPQISALNTSTNPISTTPTTNNGVSNSTSGSQYSPGQVAAGFGNISNPLIPQEQQRQAIKVDPNNITGYQERV